MSGAEKRCELFWGGVRVLHRMLSGMEDSVAGPPPIPLLTVLAVFLKRLVSALEVVAAFQGDTTHGALSIAPAPPDAGVAPAQCVLLDSLGVRRQGTADGALGMAMHTDIETRGRALEFIWCVYDGHGEDPGPPGEWGLFKHLHSPVV